MKNIAHLLTPEVVGKAYTYLDYLSMTEKLVEAGMTSGPVQNEELSHYTRLNLSRMQRVYKTVKLEDELLQAVREIQEPQDWYIITEAWCGDAAQNVPVLAVLAQENPLINLKLILRDENLAFMDAYLTNGGRSIPKLIAVDVRQNELFTWGPRPEPTYELFMEYKNNPEMGHDAFAEKIQRWYLADKSMSLQQEIRNLLTAVEA
ncbi:thioredoxin family protein [Dyadobacter tibetensis]|uniref:thioredoxin family protein n=1 Tax=Dyadobacter tibetensis TaxID=1211851 RepID=UPI00046F63A4|nr:thioredoxin family protein [Dyadobacter tibetensis]